MSIFEHQRFEIFSGVQHPYKHSLSELQYSNEATGTGVTTAQQAMDWVFAVLYPRHKPDVATPSDLPSTGNTVNDYRVVNDDGDGKAAGYRWFQAEGDASASWHKVMDYDWSSDQILSGYLDKTQDLYVSKYGRDDTDDDGNVISGVLAGQSIFGGSSASTNLSLFANTGDGAGANTGYVQFGDDVRPTTDNSRDLGTASEAWKTIFGYTLTLGTLTASEGAISDSSGAIDFSATDLTTTGDITGTTFTGTTVVLGTLTLGAGSITDSSGTIDFGTDDLTTTGTVTAGTLTLGSGSITDSSGAISLGNENLSTTGSITGNTVKGGNLLLSGNTLAPQDTNGSITLEANGTGDIDIQSPMLTKDITTSGDVDVTGTLAVGNLLLSADTLSTTDTNGSLILAPNGTGKVQINTTLFPGTDDSFDLGDATHRFQDLYLSSGISDGTNSMATTDLLSLREINTGVSTGMSIFYDGAKWVASVPDTEIDHGTITGLLDDDHTQYMLLAGRSGGQTLYGGSSASEDLTLDSTSDATKGNIILGSVPCGASDNSLDLGTSGVSFKDLYLKGQAKGLRLENFTTSGRPSASASTPGRVIWDSDLSDMLVDQGGSWSKLSLDKIKVTDTASWDGATTTVTYTVDGSGSGTGLTFDGKVSDARDCIWRLIDNSNSYKDMTGIEVTKTQTTVTFTFGTDFPPAAGTYTVIGVG